VIKVFGKENIKVGLFVFSFFRSLDDDRHDERKRYQRAAHDYYWWLDQLGFLRISYQYVG
jgi:hypothetical protein